MNFEKLAKKYDTPLYVYNFNNIEKNYKKLKEAFKGKKSLIAYAIKANSNLSVLKHIKELGCGADCVSIGELRKALMAGIDKYKIIFSGVGKKDEEIKEALEENILYINVESKAELLTVENIAKNLKIKARISVRVNPNIDPKTHPYISTGLKNNKFGVNEEEAKKMYLIAKKSKYLDPIGIHFHIGSQLNDISPIIKASKKIAKLTKNLLALDIDIKFFNIGGGLGIKYTDEQEINPYDYVQGILSTINGLDLTIITEPGRYIIANAGYFVSKVLYEKENQNKKFIIIDGAMNDLIRPSLYGAYHKVINFKESKELYKVDIVGPICESGDFLAKDISLPKMNKGDILVFKNAGAYGFVMASNYNSRLKCMEVGILNDKDFIIRKRETFNELIKAELI